MTLPKIANEMKKLTNYFLLFILGFFGMIIVAAFQMSIALVIFFMLLAVISGWLFLFKLGALAQILSRSWLVWAGSSLIFAPLGIFIAYFNMRRVVNNELRKVD